MSLKIKPQWPHFLFSLSQFTSQRKKGRRRLPLLPRCLHPQSVCYRCFICRPVWLTLQYSPTDMPGMRDEETSCWRVRHLADGRLCPLLPELCCKLTVDVMLYINTAEHH